MVRTQNDSIVFDINALEVKKLSKKDYHKAETFYKACGRRHEINAEEILFAAFYKSAALSDDPLGIVRLAFENNCYVLRGMQVAPNFQFNGVGTKLVQQLERYLDEMVPNEHCYCLPHDWLEKFYGKSGFKKISTEEYINCPSFLVQRLLEHKEKFPHLILMRR